MIPRLKEGDLGEITLRNHPGEKGDFEGEKGGSLYGGDPSHPQSPITHDIGDGFRVLVRRSVDGWINLKLETSADLPKRNWWLAWNGERFAGSRDYRLLAEHQPAVHQRLTAAMARIAPSRLLS